MLQDPHLKLLGASEFTPFFSHAPTLALKTYILKARLSENPKPLNGTG